MFIKLTKAIDSKPMLINVNKVTGFFGSYLDADNTPCTDIEYVEGTLEVKETVEEIEEMLALRAHPSWNDRFLNQLASARKGLKSRLGES